MKKGKFRATAAESNSGRYITSLAVLDVRGLQVLSLLIGKNEKAILVKCGFNINHLYR